MLFSGLLKTMCTTHTIFHCRSEGKRPSTIFFTPTKSPECYQKDKTSNFIKLINQLLSRFARYTSVSFHKSRLASSLKSTSPKNDQNGTVFFFIVTILQQIL